MSVLAFSSTSRAVPISDAALPWYVLVADVGALAGGVLVAWALDALGRRPSVVISCSGSALSMLGCAAAAATGSRGLVLAASTVAAFFATCAWVSAYPTSSEQFPTHLRA